MSSMRVRLFRLFLGILMCSASAAIVAAAQQQEKEKPKTTVDAWRQALPSESEAASSAEENPAILSLPSADETKKNLLSLEQRWMDSLKVADADSLDQIISSDFTFASPRLVDIKDRTKYLEHALSDLKLTSYEFDKTTVKLFGKTATVTGLLKQKATVRGEDWSGRYLVTDVWISRDGIWRVVSRHESPFPEQK